MQNFLIIMILMQAPVTSIAFGEEAPPVEVNAEAVSQISDDMVKQPDSENVFLYNQLGANQGYYALGIGRTFSKGTELSSSLGFNPTRSNLRSWQLQLNIAHDWQVWNSGNAILDLGLATHIDLSQDTFLFLDSKYPEGYYPQNKMIFSFNSRFHYKNFFFAASLLDYYVEVLARNSLDQWVEIKPISLGLGFRF